jgi:hypothetical protein
VVLLAANEGELGVLDLVSEGGQTGSVEDLGGRITHFFHCEMDPAHRLVAAVCAGQVGGLAGTGNRCKRAIEETHDLAEVYVRGVAGESVPSALSLPALQNPVVAKAQQDELEKFGWDLLRSSEVDDPHRLLVLDVSERQQRFYCVLGFLGEHRSLPSYVVAITEQVVTQQLVEYGLLWGCQIVPPTITGTLDGSLLDVPLELGGLWQLGEL